jgi:sterol desaturase/sphingolipid hydroxylase (fatty acid hydroxylase superfamily)
MTSFWLPQIIAYFATFIYGSFFEWTLHRFVMHRRQPLVPYPFELHAMVHHKLFQSDETFHAKNKEVLNHVTFVPRDYLILLCVNAPLFLAVEFLTGLPVAIGASFAVLTYLVMFDTVHWMFHVPRSRFFENLGPYRWLKRHHLLHHRYQTRNLNVVFPLADFVLGTRVSAPNPGAQVLQV